jgi:prepilin-type N-terminal cleavage/methylation domain-containing protein
MIHRSKHAELTPRKQQERGFTLTEVIIAGAILATSMASVGRMMINALANSSNQAERVRIEQAINDNIQMLQMHDSYLTLQDTMKQSERDEACANPTGHLENHLAQEVPPPNPQGISRNISREFKRLDSNDMDILIVEYKFYAPRNSGKSNADERWEYRRAELNPNFTAKCYTTVS